MPANGKKLSVTYAEANMLELRLYEDTGKDTYLSWKMGLHEACDLVAWWRNEGCDHTDTQSPIRGRRFGSVLICMTSPNFVDVRMLSEYGTPKRQGCSLPREMLQFLTTFLALHDRDVAGSAPENSPKP